MNNIFLIDIVVCTFAVGAFVVCLLATISKIIFDAINRKQKIHADKFMILIERGLIIVIFCGAYILISRIRFGYSWEEVTDFINALKING